MFGFSKKIIESDDAKQSYINQRRNAINEGKSNERIESLLSKIKYDYNEMKEKVGNIIGKEKHDDEVKDITNNLFKAYGKGDKERAEFELKLQEIQSHVTRSLKKTDEKIEKTDEKIEQTDKKLDLILKYLKAEAGKKLE